MSARSTSILVLLVLFSTVALAQQIYKWKDKKGQWHFSDTPPAEVRAERVKGLEVGPVPPVPPQIVEPPTTSGGSAREERAVSKAPTERKSSASSIRMTKSWLLLYSMKGIPWESFESAEACEQYKHKLVTATLHGRVGSIGGGGTPGGSPYMTSVCVSLFDFELSKEANVIVVIAGVGGAQRGRMRSVLSGRVFNKGVATARNVVVKYKAFNASGFIVGRGNIRIVPSDLPGLTAGEFSSEIRGGTGVAGLRVKTEVDWSRD